MFTPKRLAERSKKLKLLYPNGLPKKCYNMSLDNMSIITFLPDNMPTNLEYMRDTIGSFELTKHIYVIGVDVAKDIVDVKPYSIFKIIN